MNDALEATAEATGGLYFDFASQFPDDRAMFIDPVHMTEQGTELHGRLVAEFLDRSGILRP